PATTSRPMRVWRPWSRGSTDFPDHAVGVRATRDRRWASAHSVTAETWRPRKTDNTSVAAVRPPLKPMPLSDILQPGVDFLLSLVLGVTVTLLQTSSELLALALDDVEIVVGELAPLLLGLTLELLPVSLHAIPIHLSSPPYVCSREIGDAGATRRDRIGSSSLSETAGRRNGTGAADYNVDCARDLPAEHGEGVMGGRSQ